MCFDKWVLHGSLKVNAVCCLNGTAFLQPTITKLRCQSNALMNILKSGALADFCLFCNGNEPFVFLSNYEGVDLASSAADVLDIFSEVCCETASALSFARVPATLFPSIPPI